MQDRDAVAMTRLGDASLDQVLGWIRDRCQGQAGADQADQIAALEAKCEGLKRENSQLQDQVVQLLIARDQCANLLATAERENRKLKTRVNLFQDARDAYEAFRARVDGGGLG